MPRLRHISTQFSSGKVACCVGDLSLIVHAHWSSLPKLPSWSRKSKTEGLNLIEMLSLYKNKKNVYRESGMCKIRYLNVTNYTNKT